MGVSIPFICERTGHFMKLSNSAKEEKEGIIVQAAVKVFARKGYYHSKIQDIAQEAKIAYGLFYHYFKSKDDILLTIFQNAWRNLVKEIDVIIERTADPVQRLREVIHYMFRSYSYDRNLLKVLIMDVPRLEKFYEKKNLVLYKVPYTKIAEIIEDGRKAGVFKQDISPITLSQVLMGTIDSIIRHDVYDIIPGKKEKMNINKITQRIHGILIDSIKKK